MKILIIVPAYNEAANLPPLIDAIKQECSGMDYVIINDCSTDNTEEICNDMQYRYISLPVNLGIGGAMQTGYLYAQQQGYDIAVQADGDGQHDPAFIKDIIRPIIDGKADMVIGSRFINKDGFQSTAGRRLGIKILSGIIKICTGQTVTDVTSGFRAANRSVIELFSEAYAQDYPEPESIVTAIVNNRRVVETPVLMKARQYGKSSINLLKSFYYMTKVSLAILIYRFIGRKDWNK